MSKLIFACCMLSSVSLLEPGQITNFFGPSAQVFVGKVRSALDITTIMPGLWRTDRR